MRTVRYRLQHIFVREALTRKTKKKTMWILSVLTCAVLLTTIDCYQEVRPFKTINKLYCKLQENCEQLTTNEYTYRALHEIEEKNDPGFKARLSFFVMGDRDAHVVLSSYELATWDVDVKDVYEIHIGRINKNTAIRRKVKGEDKAVGRTPDILTRRAPLRVDVDVTTDGEIRVYVEHTEGPIVTWKDPNPLSVEYYGFAAFSEPVTFFHKCRNL